MDNSENCFFKYNDSENYDINILVHHDRNVRGRRSFGNTPYPFYLREGLIIGLGIDR